MALDVSFQDEEAVSDSLVDVIDEMLGLDGTVHGVGMVSSFAFMADSEGSVKHCDSSYKPERLAMSKYVKTRLEELGFDINRAAGYNRIGWFMITISPFAAEDDELYNKAYDQMHRGLRNVLSAWARHRNRFLMVSFHQAQFDGPDILQDHVHVLYVRYDTDTRNMCTEELYKLCDGKCSWDIIDVALGGIKLPEYEDDDEVYSDDVYKSDEFAKSNKA